MANYSTGKRRFDCYANATEAIEAATGLAKKMSKRQVVATSVTNQQAAAYAVENPAPFNVSLPSVASTVAECLKLVGGLTDLHAAAKFYAARHKRTECRPVADVVAELLSVKEKRKASGRYLGNLRFRLHRFAETFKKNACDVTTAELQSWLDGQKLAPQSYTNFRRVVHALFECSVARG